MDEILDNPAWYGLSTGNQLLAHGNEQVKYFSREVSPFIGFDVLKPEKFTILADMIPAGRSVAFFSHASYEVPSAWKLLRTLNVAQMVFDGAEPDRVSNSQIRLLDRTDISEILALTKLTNPGPFFKNTIEFGEFYGLFENHKLVAMTGERLKPNPFVEVSAVCTHPDHTGKGYAKILTAIQVQKILHRSSVPILHVLNENHGAIALYEKLGFLIRRNFVIHVIMKS